jgi:hypothetical protein
MPRREPAGAVGGTRSLRARTAGGPGPHRPSRSFTAQPKENVVIAVGTVLTILLLLAAWRSGSWLVAVLGIAVGASASGPVSSLINTLVDAGTSLASSLDSLL